MGAPARFSDVEMTNGEVTASLAVVRENSLRNYLARRAGEHHGRRVMRPREQEVLHHYLLGAADLKEVFSRLRAFHFMLKERLGNGIFVCRTEGAYTYLNINYAWKAAKEPALDEATIESLVPFVNFLQWAIDREIPWLEVSVPWGRSEATLQTLATLTGNVVFDAPRIVFKIPAEMLAAPVVRTLDELPDYYVLLPSYSVLGFTRGKNGKDYILKVVQRFFDMQQRMPTLVDLAELFGQSVSSVKRTLQADGLSFRALVNQCKYDCACALLGNGGLSIKEVAFRLGYNDHNAFRRAFKEWSGVQPSKWRASATV